MPNFDTNTCQFLLFPCLQVGFLQFISPPPVKHSEKSGINVKWQHSPKKCTRTLSKILECVQAVSSTSAVENTIPWMMEVTLVHLEVHKGTKSGEHCPPHFAHPTLTFCCFQFHVFLGNANLQVGVTNAQ